MIRAWLVAVALVAAACGVDTAACELAAGPTRPATEPEVRTILARSCAVGGCHQRAPGAGGLVLDVSSPAWRDAVVSVPAQQAPAVMLVAPGAPDRSWLVAKLRGAFCGATCASGCGGPMPFGAPLPDDELAAVAGWIAGGAR